MHEKILSQIGLTEKQAKIYLACLEFDVAKAPEIAHKAGIKRTTAYGILDELRSLGLINYSQKGKLKLFRAENPKTMVQLLEHRKTQIKQILPDLENIFAAHNIQPKIQFFEGKEGIKKIYEDTLKCISKKLYQIIKVKDFIDFPGGDFSKKYIAERVKRGITAYALHPRLDDVYDEIYGLEDEKLKRYCRYLPPSMFYASMIMVYDYKVAMISTKQESFGFIIESHEFSKTLKAFFDFMWQVGSKNPDI